MHRIIKSYLKVNQHSSLNHIDVHIVTLVDWNKSPKNIPPEQLKRIDNIDEMENNIISRNQQYFQQRRGTPFTVKPLKFLLGIDGCTDAYDQILNVNFDYLSLDITKLQISYTKELINHSGIL